MKERQRIPPLCEGIVEDEVSGHGVADHRWVLFPSYVAPNPVDGQPAEWRDLVCEKCGMVSPGWARMGDPFIADDMGTSWNENHEGGLPSATEAYGAPAGTGPEDTRGHPTFHEQMEEIGHRIDRNTALIPWIALMVLVGIVLWWIH